MKTRSKPKRGASSAEVEQLRLRRNHVAGGTVKLLDYESKGKGTGPSSGGGKKRMATVGLLTAPGSLSRSPTLGIAKSIRDALDPNKVPKKVETFAEMSDEKKAEMMKLYGKKP